jgi:hypothetical protein
MCCIKRDLLNGQSSPGTLQVGQHPSKGTRQIPHTSSSGSPFSSVLPVSHCHWAMACHCLTMTFMVGFERRVCLPLCTRQDGGTVGPSCPRLHVKVPAGVVLPAGCQRCRGGKKRRQTRLEKDCWNGGEVYNWMTGIKGAKESGRVCLP